MSSLTDKKAMEILKNVITMQENVWREHKSNAFHNGLKIVHNLATYSANSTRHWISFQTKLFLQYDSCILFHAPHSLWAPLLLQLHILTSGMICPSCITGQLPWDARKISFWYVVLHFPHLENFPKSSILWWVSSNPLHYLVPSPLPLPCLMFLKFIG